ncbi:hypothetical protein BHO_0900030 (plasmid) [Borrelia hermsii YBT]|uniref:Uncharacterized protein n=1 Tax=Borrelia hermsii YBT TaxID=1313295 RepID=W5T1M7_BORHE|nr:hypothetical protein BHO_0900030 [Borrelia hermsii YBT]
MSRMKTNQMVWQMEPAASDVGKALSTLIISIINVKKFLC